MKLVMTRWSILTCFFLSPQVEVCCFDKTGTLTSDHLLLEEVVGPGKGGMCDLIMATCQSLVQLEGGEMVGDPLEKASLEVSSGQARSSLYCMTDLVPHVLPTNRQQAGHLPMTRPPAQTSLARLSLSTATTSIQISSACPLLSITRCGQYKCEVIW